MVKFSVTVGSWVRDAAAMLAPAGRRRASRGLTLVEYVLGASVAVGILFVLREPLADIATTILGDIRDALGQ